MVEVQKQDFLRFLTCARDPLRRFAWSRFKNRIFYDFCKPRATLCGDSRGRGSTTEDFLRFLTCARIRFLQAARDALRGSCVSKRSRCGAVRICCSSRLARPRGRGFIPPGPRQLRLQNRSFLSTNVVRGACSCSPGWKIATFKYRRSMRSVLPQLRLKNHNF